jgi:hypothetical protein
MSSAPPTLAIILIVRAAQDSPDAVLSALADQITPGQAEVIVIDGREEANPAPSGIMQGVRLVMAPGFNMPMLKARGVASTAAAMVAFLEPKAVPCPGWVAALLAAAKANPGAAIGGPVLFAGLQNATNQAAFIFEYADFSVSQLSNGTTADLPGNNMALPRAALLEFCGDILVSDGLNKPFCQARLRAGGVRLCMVPDMAVALTTRHRLLPLLRSRAGYARCFGGLRVALADQGGRWAFRIGAPAVPFLVLKKQLAAARRAETGRRRFGTMPALMLLCMAWAAGEISGYWFGPGIACKSLY